MLICPRFQGQCGYIAPSTSMPGGLQPPSEEEEKQQAAAKQQGVIFVLEQASLEVARVGKVRTGEPATLAAQNQFCSYADIHQHLEALNSHPSNACKACWQQTAQCFVVRVD